MNPREKYRTNTLSYLVGCHDFVNPAKNWTLEQMNRGLVVGVIEDREEE